MKIAIVTAQTLQGSTNIGRILPLAEELSVRREVHVIVHKGKAKIAPAVVKIHQCGRDPFQRTPQGKKRLRGVSLVGRLIVNILASTFKLLRLQPDVIIVSKSLPESVGAAAVASGIYRLFALLKITQRPRIILDVDDFETTANVISSINQRAVMHAAERIGAHIANAIIAATPFLFDHFEQLTQGKKNIVLIPTGLVERPPTPAHGVSPSHDKAVLLYLGSVSGASGHRIDLLPEILLQTQKHFPTVRLIIAGDGDDTESLKRAFAEKDIEKSVEWHGRFTAEDINELMQQAAILIDPIDGSITNRAKSSSRVALAMSFGKAVVTSDIGIRPQLIPTSLHPRFFAALASARGYAKQIVALLNQPVTDKESEAMMAHAKTFTWNELVTQYQHVLDL